MKSLVLANAWSANKKYQWTVFSREYLWILQKFMSLLTFKYMCVCRDDQNSMTTLSCKLLQTPDVLFHFTKSSECNKRFGYLVVIHQFLRHPKSSFISDSYFPASVSSRVATDRESPLPLFSGNWSPVTRKSGFKMIENMGIPQENAQDGRKSVKSTGQV